MFRFGKLVLVFSFVLGFSSCATTPKESGALSSELGTMVRSARTAHLNLVDEYIKQRKARVDDFLNYTWIPTYMKNFAERADFAAVYGAEKDPSQKAKILEEFQERASRDIAKQRALMMDAIDEIGNALRNRLTEHYDMMLSVNEVLTAHLNSTAKITEAREDVQKRLRLPIDQIIPLDKLDALLTKIENAEGKAATIDQMVQEAKQVIAQEAVNGK